MWEPDKCRPPTLANKKGSPYNDKAPERIGDQGDSLNPKPLNPMAPITINKGRGILRLLLNPYLKVHGTINKATILTSNYIPS